MIFVKHIDQGDEALGLVTPVGIHDGNAVHKDRVERFGKCQVIGAAQRFVAEIVEAEPGDLARLLRHMEHTALNLDFGRLNIGVADKPGKGGIQGTGRRLVHGDVVESGFREEGHAVVLLRLHGDNIQLLFQHRDEGQEELAVDPAGVKVAGVPVRGRHNNNAADKELLEQTAQDHCVSDVRDMEFVEADQHARRRHLVGDGTDRIGIAVVSARLAFLMYGPVDLLHEGVEVDTALGLNGGRFEEEIHQHGLAAPDTTVEVDATGRLDRGITPQQTRQKTAVPLHRGRKGLRQLVQPFHGCSLHGIVAEFAGTTECGIVIKRAGYHARNREKRSSFRPEAGAVSRRRLDRTPVLAWDRADKGVLIMSNLDLCYTSATELARRIAAGEQSPVAIVENSLERIEEVNGTLNCFCFTYPDEALEQAKAAEAAVKAGDPLGALHGVPIAIKDFTPTKGKTTTLGSVVYKDNVPDDDAQIVKDLLGAGAIMVGKTTTPEFAHDGFTHSPLWGTTRNPWNPERTPGGSSGGSGAAVASGCVPLAEGSDMGGSVRIPASFCGTVGLKPSLGRIPMTVLPTVFDNISHFGPLARTLDDAALFLDIAQGPFEPDIMSNPVPIDITRPVPGDVTGLRIAMDMDLGIYHVDDEVAANVEACAAALRDAGAVVEEVDLGWTPDCVDAWLVYWNVYLAAFFEQHLDTRRDDLDPTIAGMFDAARKVSAIEFKRLEFVRTAQWHKLCQVFETHDALICPTTPVPAPSANSSDAEQLGMRPDGKMNSSDMTLVFNNVAQCPALSVPSGIHSSGLPTALQIVGHRFDDLTVLRIGVAVEKARPWAEKRPKLV